MNDKEKTGKIDEIVNVTLAGVKEMFEPLKNKIDSTIAQDRQSKTGSEITSLREKLLSKFK